MKQLIDVVSRFFHLGGWRQVARLAGGVLNEVYLVETSHGHYILKVNRVRQSRVEFEQLSSFLSYLEQRQLSVDGFVRTTEGQVFVQVDGTLLTVHRYIPGIVHQSPRALTSIQIKNMIEFLAIYHSAVGEYQITQELMVSDEILPVVYTEDPNRLTRQLERLPKTTAAIESTVNRAIEKLGTFWSSSSYKALRRTLNHGDFRSCNVVFDGDRVEGLLDWDLLSDGPRLLDVVVASNDLAKTVGGSLSNYPNTWLERFGHYFSTYGSAANQLGMEVTESEIEAIPYILVADTILSGVFFALLLQKLPLKPDETVGERNQRSKRLLEESVNDLVALDRLIESGSILLKSNRSVPHRGVEGRYRGRSSQGGEEAATSRPPPHSPSPHGGEGAGG